MDIFDSLTLGAYVDKDSPVHRLDPRAKIIDIFVLSLALFFMRGPGGYVVFAALLFAVILASSLPLRFVLRGLLPLLWIIVFTFLLHLFFTKGSPVFKAGPVTVTRHGLYLAWFITLRLVLLVLTASLLTLTTSPEKLTLGLKYLLVPLKVFGISPENISLMIALALRFVPVLLLDTQRLVNLQKSRGANFKGGGILKRMRAVTAVVLPLLSGVFRRADELALAMESRGFEADRRRTHLEEIKFSFSDAVSIGITCMVAGVMLSI